MSEIVTVTITDFLLARIAEDEEAARACAEAFPSPWEVADRGWRVRIYAANVPDVGDHAEPGDERAPCVIEVEPERHHDLLNQGGWLSDRVEHIARHDPARVLAECEAKRRIVELHRIAMWTRHVRVIGNPAGYEDRRAESHCVTCDPDGNEQDGPCLTLRALASVYADHADFDPAWA